MINIIIIMIVHRASAKSRGRFNLGSTSLCEVTLQICVKSRHCSSSHVNGLYIDIMFDVESGRSSYVVRVKSRIK